MTGSGQIEVYLLSSLYDSANLINDFDTSFGSHNFPARSK